MPKHEAKAMELQKAAVARIVRYCFARRISEGTFGLYAVRDTSFVDRLRRGKVTINTLRRALEWLARQESKMGAGNSDGGSA